MIPAVPGAAAAALLLLALAALVGLGLLGWWSWRRWHAAKGRPRPPLKIWQWGLAVLLSILPIFALVTIAEMLWSSHLQDERQAEQDRLMHITLKQPAMWGDITLPAGSHLQRDMPEGGVERADGTPDLRALNDIRFPHPVQVGGTVGEKVGGIRVNALSMGGQLVLELDRPHQFAAQDGKPAENCERGTMAQFRHRSNEKDAMINWEQFRRPQTLVLADWVFETCYLARPIALRYWRDGELVWTGEPDYAHEK